MQTQNSIIILRRIMSSIKMWNIPTKYDYPYSYKKVRKRRKHDYDPKIKYFFPHVPFLFITFIFLAPKNEMGYCTKSFQQKLNEEIMHEYLSMGILFQITILSKSFFCFKVKVFWKEVRQYINSLFRSLDVMFHYFPPNLYSWLSIVYCCRNIK